MRSIVRTCNKCGKKFDEWDTEEDFSIYSTLGYGTVYDGSKLELDLCCKCMEELIGSCAISPIVDIYRTEGSV